MRVAGWITGGTMAALLLAVPAGGSPDILPPDSVFADDLLAGSSTARPGQALQMREAISQLEPLIREPDVFRMIGASTGRASSDFAVMLDTRSGRNRVFGVEIFDAPAGGRRSQNCEAPLSAALAGGLEAVFAHMVRRTRYGSFRREQYDPPRHVSYPFHFHFAVPNFVMPVEGLAPAQLFRDSRPELMVLAGMTLRDYCRSRETRHVELLQDTLRRLQERQKEGSLFDPPPRGTLK
jgi:hypothetical protein